MAETATKPAILPALWQGVRERTSARREQIAANRLAAMETRQTVAQGLTTTPDGGITINGTRVTGVSRKGRVPVSRINAPTIAAFWRCVNLLSGAIGQMPLVPRTWDGQTLRDNSYFPLLVEPDPDLSRFSALKQIMTGLLVDGEAFGLVTSWGPDGEAESIRVLSWLEASPHIDPTTHRVIGWSVYGMRLPPHAVIHFRGLTFPGEYRPLSPIVYAERILSNMIAQDEAAVESLVSGGIPNGYFSHSAIPPPEAVEQAKKAWAEGVAGRDRTPPVFPGQLQYHPLEHSPESLQFLASRKWTAQEVAIFMGVSPSVIGLPSDDNKTYSSALMELKAFVTWSLSDWMANIAGEFSRFLPPGIECEFSTAKLLEPSRKERAEAQAIGVENGWLLPEEVRQEEGLPYRDDLPDVDDLPSVKVIRQLLGKNPEPSEPEVGVAA